MLYKSFSLLSLILLGDVVNCKYVTIVTTTDVLYKKTMLPFRCLPKGVAHSGTITDITLWKNSTSGWNRIVKIWLKVENGKADNDIAWTDTDIMNRASILQKEVHPSSQAGLHIEIRKTNVKCSDKGDYKCSIRGSSDSFILNSESATKTVGMRAEPPSINPIQVQPQQLDNKYNPYTSVKLTCNGDVVNPKSNLRWCIRTTGSNKMSDFTVYDNTNDITHSTPTLSGCLRQQSVLTYNISATIPQADFRCEIGGTSTTCGHSSAIAANYTIYRCNGVDCEYVKIATDNEVKYQQQKLQFTCSPMGAALNGTITDITLWKNSPSRWKRIVKISLGISNGQFVNEITWTNTDIMNRSNFVNQKVYPSNQADLKIEIRPTNVRCSDEGEYKCSISGYSDSISGSVRLVSESAPKNVAMSGDVENCPADVIIATDNEVKYQQEKLPFTCSPTGAALTGTITDITLWKNSPSGWKRIVKIFLGISKDKFVNEITWTNTDIRDRSNIVNRKVYPSNQAGLQIEIRPTNVTCSDQGEYKCSIGGNSASISGSASLINESAPTNVAMSGDALNCQVTFATDMNVLYQQDKLPFTCTPRGAALMGTITDITLWKNSASGWNKIVRTWLSIENGQVVNEFEWANTDIKNHAPIINKKVVSPSSEAGLEIEITPANVKYSDKGDYKCSISGNSGSISISSESAPKTVAIPVANNISSGNLFPNPINYFVLCIMYSSIL